MALNPDSTILVIVDIGIKYIVYIYIYIYIDGYSLFIHLGSQLPLANYNFRGVVNTLKFSPDGKY